MMTPERQIVILQRTLERRHNFWMRAAKAALEGDTRELQNRVDMYEAGKVEIALSAEDFS